MTLPLEGVKVVDLTNVMAGPYCAMVLGDLGADVIKIESFPDGDASRRFDPKVNGESYCFAVLNRNKRSIALDLKAPRGKEVFLKLAAGADIVIENFRPGVVNRLGIDHETLLALNPALVYASMSGFGQTGPYGNKGGFDIIAQGMSGIMMMTGHPGGRPAKVGIAMNDIASGVTAPSSDGSTYFGTSHRPTKALSTSAARHAQKSIREYHQKSPSLAWSFLNTRKLYHFHEVFTIGQKAFVMIRGIERRCRSDVINNPPVSSAPAAIQMSFAGMGVPAVFRNVKTRA